MEEPDGQDNAERAHQIEAPSPRIERWIAPGILVLIALWQIYQATAGSLSPWKGGGMGMFSSIDAPSMRVLSAEAINEDGQRIIIDASNGLDDSKWDSMRARPLQRELVDLGFDLIDQRFVPIGAWSEKIAEKVKNQNLRATLPAIVRSEEPIYRVHDPDDKRPVDKIPDAILLRSIRLQWKRLSYDAPSGDLKTKELYPAITIGPWQEGPLSMEKTENRPDPAPSKKP